MVGDENADMQDKVNGCITSEDIAKAIQESEQKRIVWLAYYQGQVFQKFEEKESLVSMVLKLNVSKSAIIFKIDYFPKIKNSSLSFHYF